MATVEKSTRGANSRDEGPGAEPGADLWLVDGYNVLNTSAFRVGDEPDAGAGAAEWWSDAMRERLVAVARRFPHPDTEIWIVFDGARPAQETQRGEHPSVHVEFAASADDWIVERVRSARDPRSVAVVTRDRQVTGRVRHRGATVVWPLEFLRRCGLAVPVGRSGEVDETTQG